MRSSILYTPRLYKSNAFQTAGMFWEEGHEKDFMGTDREPSSANVANCFYFLFLLAFLFLPFSLPPSLCKRSWINTLQLWEQPHLLFFFYQKFPLPKLLVQNENMHLEVCCYYFLSKTKMNLSYKQPNCVGQLFFFKFFFLHQGDLVASNCWSPFAEYKQRKGTDLS